MKTTQFRICARTFRRLAAAGEFGDTKVELLDGRLEIMTSGPAHDYVVAKLAELLRACLGRGAWTVREEKPLRLGRFWRPAPDIAVVRGSLESYRNLTPGRLDAALLIEVADSTYSKDSGAKLTRYLECGIPAYWIVDVNRRVVEVRDMQAEHGPVLAVYSEGQAIPLTLDGREYAAVAVGDVLA